MSAGPGSALGEPRAGSLQIAGSAVVVGRARLGEGSILAEGAVIRSDDRGVEVGTGSAVLENSVIVGNTRIPTIIGRRSVFGHRCTVIGATVGDLCEIGNASILMPGARLGDRVFLGDAGDQGRHAHHHDLPSRHRLTLPDNQRSRPMSRAVQFSEYGTPTDVLRV